MESVTAHLQQYWILYSLGGLCLFFVVYFTQKYTLPVIQWTAELALYMACVHVVLHYFVQLVKWFKLNTMMYWQERIDPGWQTPLQRFWDRAEYNPAWLFYAEVVVAVLMVAAMVRYRPMKVQKIKPRRPPIQKGKVPDSLRARYGGKPPQAGLRG